MHITEIESWKIKFKIGQGYTELYADIINYYNKLFFLLGRPKAIEDIVE